MTDDKSKTGGADRARINRNEDYEVRDWAAKFGVSKDRLLETIDKVGPMAAHVAEKLGKSL